MRVGRVTALFLCAAGVVLGTSWRVQLGVQSATLMYLDWYNYFGISPDASDGWDMYDVVNMFSPELYYIDLYFPHDDSSRPDYWPPPHNEKFSIDIRSDSTPVLTFYFDVFVQTMWSESVAVFWVEVDSVPPCDLVEISPLRAEGVNIFSADTIWMRLSPGVYYFVARVKRNALERLEVLPKVIFLRVGERLRLSARLTGPHDTVFVRPQWTVLGDGLDIDDDGCATATEEGDGKVVACFRGWCDTASFFVSGEAAVFVELPLRKGWNLISLPVMPSTPLAAAVFPFAYPNIYRYESARQTYEVAETLRAGEGYFVLAFRDTSATVYGAPVNEVSLALSPGWHLVGGPIAPVQAEDVAVHPNDALIPPIFSMDKGIYAGYDRFEPGRGYWMLLLQEAMVGISPRR